MLNKKKMDWVKKEQKVRTASTLEALHGHRGDWPEGRLETGIDQWEHNKKWADPCTLQHGTE